MDDPERQNERTSRSVITLTVLHPSELDPERMSDVDVANQIVMGRFVGARTALDTSDVADDDVPAELEALGAQGDHFRRAPTLFENLDV